MKNSLDQVKTPPLPPTRRTSGIGIGGSNPPPPPPVRKGSIKSSSHTPPLSPQLGGKPLPPPPPKRSENPTIEKNKCIPLPPQIQSKQTFSGNGHEDYDVPRPLSNRYSDYDVPLSQEKREVKERALREASGISGDYSVPMSKEERLHKDKLGCLDWSSGSWSRPISNASSVFSADASTISSHSSSSGGVKLGTPAEEETGRFSPSIDHQLEMITQMVGDAKNSENLMKVSTENLLPKMKSLDEDVSSHDGSNDNLGVWDDVSSEPDSDEMEG